MQWEVTLPKITQDYYDSCISEAGNGKAEPDLLSCALNCVNPSWPMAFDQLTCTCRQKGCGQSS